MRALIDALSNATVMVAGLATLAFFYVVAPAFLLIWYSEGWMALVNVALAVVGR